MRYANEVIIEELKNDRNFLKVYLKDTIIGFFNGEINFSCLMLRDIVNATIGLPNLAVGIIISISLFLVVLVIVAFVSIILIVPMFSLIILVFFLFLWALHRTWFMN